MEVVGKGSAKVKMNGVIHLIYDVYFVTELNNNLLSIGPLREKELMCYSKEDTETANYIIHRRG